MYYVVLAIFLAGFLLIYRIIHSPFGQVLKAIRENEPRAISLGYKTDRYKLVAFVLSATLAGLAGATKAIVFQLASLTDVHWTMSGEVVLMTLVGGLGTMFGPVVGAFVIIAMQNYLAAARRMGDGHPGRDLRRLRAGCSAAASSASSRNLLAGIKLVRARPARSEYSRSSTQGESAMSAEARLKELGIVLPAFRRRSRTMCRIASPAICCFWPGRVRAAPTASC